MDPVVAGKTLELLGEIAIAFAVIMVHSRVIREEHIDKKVERMMEAEQLFALGGIALLVTGFILQVS